MRHTFVRRSETRKRYLVSDEADEICSDLIRREPDGDRAVHDIGRRRGADDIETRVAESEIAFAQIDGAHVQRGAREAKGRGRRLARGIEETSDDRAIRAGAQG